MATVVAARLLLACYPPSYIHADEFFQNQEVMASTVLGVDAVRPWEWDEGTAARSVLMPATVSGAVFMVLRYVAHHTGINAILSGYVLLFAPRLVMVALSLLIDGVVLAVCDSPSYRGKLSAVSASLFLSTSWVMVVFSARPFSNTCEALVLAAAIGILLLCDPGPTRAIFLGLTLAVGTFTRFTFIAFFFPIGLALLAQEDFREHVRWIGRSRSTGKLLSETVSHDREDKKQAAGRLIFSERARTAFNVLSYGALGGVLGTAPCVLFDSVYYNHLTITPLNNALYNMQTKNLAEHGIHPRWLHALVNMPLLFGPATLVAYVKAVFCMRRLSCGQKSVRSSPRNRSIAGLRDLHSQPFVEKRALSGTIDIEELCIGCIVSGIGMLSIAPHQEPRFLVPLLVPIALISSSVGPRWRNYLRNGGIQAKHGKDISSADRSCFNAVRRQGTRRFIIWLVFNAALTIFFGVLHQGGLLRVLLLLESRSNLPQAPPSQAYFFKTHMPPRFILSNKVSGGKPGDPGFCEIIDMKSSSVDDLQTVLFNRDKSSAALEWGGKIYVVAPASVHLARDHKLGKCLTIDSTFWPHLSTEDLPKQMDDLELEMFVYNKRCHIQG